MEQNTALVSVIIPVYNRADLAIEAIECTLSQDYPNIEIVVGDNSSTDGTYKKLKERYENNDRVILFQNEKNLGAVGNWERCLSRVKGKYIKFLWSDDLMSDDFISKAVELLEKESEVAFAFSSVYIFSNSIDLQEQDSSKISIRYRFKKKTGIYEGKDFIRATYYWNPSVPVSPGCALFRKDKLKLISDIPNKINYLHRKNGAGPDLLMFLEALAHSEKFAYIDKPCNYFREHPGSISTFDRTIADGYLTAKVYYLDKYGLEQYWHWLICDIVSTKNRRNIFSRKKNIQTLNKFIDENNKRITRHSIICIGIYKIRNRIFNKMLISGRRIKK